MMIKNIMVVLVGGISILTASSARADGYGYPKENVQLRQILSQSVPIEEVKKNAGGFLISMIIYGRIMLKSRKRIYSVCTMPLLAILP